MIDTIVITIPDGQFLIRQPELFSPNASWVLHENRPGHGFVSKQNPTARELKSGIYKPRLTLAQRRFAHSSQPIIKIEVSLPKLMFGNNFEELRYKDFERVVNTLVLSLAEMGVEISADTIAHADVSSIHYGKNIKLMDGSTPYHYIKKIQESAAPWQLDTNKTDFRNDGHSYKWHSNSYEVVFYDKIKDLEKAKMSEKRAHEKDNALQLHLLETFKKRKKVEYLRMEVRLNKRQKMKRLFAKLQIKSDLTFKKLFKPAISKGVLVHYIDELENRRSPLLDLKATSDKALLADLAFNNPNMSPKQIMQVFGMKKALDSMNLQELRIILTKSNDRSWQRLIADVSKANKQQKKNSFEEIKSKLNRFN